ncbi:hypothetical protein SAMN05444365_104440 [Micromonospora pattaloongensis]|uniref:Uncharacterized protein n=1 Tax=Micromonospora pattaloongensis TaxID=405436 RepID=A0A1H3PCN8_9ACTN|nr:hypothetical protein SAMN05444365_104440 [Micromonospora pattaloongensis]
MAGGLAGPRGRDTGLVWGTVAGLCLVSVLYAWFRSPDATDRAVFGRPLSLAVLVVSLLLTGIAAVASVVAWYGARDWSRGRRWGIAGPLVAVTVGIVVLGMGSVASTRTGSDAVLGMLLLVGAAAMAAVAMRLVRVRATASGERLRGRFEQLRKDRS